uniref:Uncharacterized protein n=1 Tax=Arundo donax TaxID=35708 RepID=A0A0A9HWA2_ARUDO
MNYEMLEVVLSRTEFLVMNLQCGLKETPILHGDLSNFAVTFLGFPMMYLDFQ